MSDLFERIAVRALGGDALVMPRLPSRFEPGRDGPAGADVLVWAEADASEARPAGVAEPLRGPVAGRTPIWLGRDVDAERGDGPWLPDPELPPAPTPAGPAALTTGEAGPDEAGPDEGPAGGPAGGTARESASSRRPARRGPAPSAPPTGLRRAAGSVSRGGSDAVAEGPVPTTVAIAEPPPAPAPSPRRRPVATRPRALAAGDPRDEPERVWLEVPVASGPAPDRPSRPVAALADPPMVSAPGLWGADRPALVRSRAAGGPSGSPEPVVQVTIGRVEVRAPAPPSRPPELARPPRRSPEGLGDYLARRSDGRFV